MKTHTNLGGWIEVIYGPMFSGKSTELIRRIRRYTKANKSAIVAKYSKDNRTDLCDEVTLVTHDKTTYHATSFSEGDLLLKSTFKKLMEYDVIGIDESQFFIGIIDFCQRLANLGKIVIVAALDSSFLMEPFAKKGVKITDLIALAEKVDKLTAVCETCFSEMGAFSRRVGDSSTELEIIGGQETYVAQCRRCYYLPYAHKNSSVVPNA